jgi:hypothetical protein
MRVSRLNTSGCLKYVTACIRIWGCVAPLRLESIERFPALYTSLSLSISSLLNGSPEMVERVLVWAVHWSWPHVRSRCSITEDIAILLRSLSVARAGISGDL